ncbi:MAG: TIGR03089 family protein [Actinomycetota bacterium]|nr:TIGR03089 family protein [Actinomycetota bacterium]
MTASTVPALLRDLLHQDPARPLVTFYDDRTGERIELSVKSFENWVAKTANLLQDELGAEPGDHVAVWLPAHWQSAVWMCAAAACGVVVSHEPDVDASVDVAVCGPDTLAAAAACGARDVVALSLRPMGQGFDEALPDGATDYARSVLAQGDTFLPLGAPDGEAAFLLTRRDRVSQRDLLGRARVRAGELGLHPAGRLLTDANPADEGGFSGGLLAAMVTGGSLVLTRNPDPAAVDGRVAQEQVTAQWWVAG